MQGSTEEQLRRFRTLVLARFTPHVILVRDLSSFSFLLFLFFFFSFRRFHTLVLARFTPPAISIFVFFSPPLF
jgi:hypothetical protein